MAQKEKIIIIVLLYCIAAHAQVAAEGGNITNVNISVQQQTTRWHGLVGSLIVVGPNQTNVSASGGQINQTDILITSACASPLINGTILFSNSSAPPVGLTAGNLAQLDTYLNSGVETGTQTFPLTDTFTIGGIPILGVPTTNTYVNSAPQAIVFREGYLNDGLGNIVFAVDINLDTIGYNGTRFDYQSLLALADNVTTPYYISTDLTVTCPGVPSGGGGRGGRGYYNAIIQRLPQIQAPLQVPEITEEEVKNIEELRPLELIAPDDITATIAETLKTPITITNPNAINAPLLTVVLRIPSIIDDIKPLHTNPLLYDLFGIIPLHGSTHTATFPPIAPIFNDLPAKQTISMTLANEIPITHPTTVIGIIEAYAGNKLVATKPITIHLTPPPFALQTEHDGNQVLILLLLNNQKREARTTNVELDYNLRHTTPFAELYTLPLTENTAELYGYTYKPAFSYDSITAASDLGRKEAR